MNVASNRVLPSRRPRTFRRLIGRLVGWTVGLALMATAGAGVCRGFSRPVAVRWPSPGLWTSRLGSSTIDIATRLHEHGVVDNSIVTMLGITAVRYAFDIEVKAGEYEFAAGSSLVDVLRKIKSGRTVVYKVSMPEGFTSWQVVERLNANDVLAGDIEEPSSRRRIASRHLSVQPGRHSPVDHRADARRAKETHRRPVADTR